MKSIIIRNYCLAVHRAYKYIQHGGEKPEIKNHCESLLATEKERYNTWLRDNAISGSVTVTAPIVPNDYDITAVQPTQYEIRWKEGYTKPDPAHKWKKVKKEIDQDAIAEKKAFESRVRDIIEKAVEEKRVIEKPSYIVDIMQDIAPKVAFSAVRYMETKLGKKLRQGIITMAGDGADIVQEAYLALIQIYNAGLAQCEEHFWTHIFYVYERINKYIYSHAKEEQQMAAFNDSVKSVVIQSSENGTERTHRQKMLSLIESYGLSVETVITALEPFLKEKNIPVVSEILTLYLSGLTLSEISEKTGRHVKTVEKYFAIAHNAYKLYKCDGDTHEIENLMKKAI